MNTVRNQAARQEISCLQENAGVALPVVGKKCSALSRSTVQEGVIECCFLVISKLRKGRAFGLLALPAPASKTATGISCVCLLFVPPFGNSRLAGLGDSSMVFDVQ